MLKAHRGYVLALAIIVPASLAYAAGSALSSGEEDPAGGQIAPFARQPVDVFDRKLPLLAPGQRTSPADAEAASGYEVRDPGGWSDDESASKEVWYSDATGEVGVRYGDSIVILYQRWLGAEDPSKVYERQMASTGTGEIFSAPQGSGWLVPGTPETNGLTSATFAIDGVEIVILTLDGPDRALEIAKRFSEEVR